MWITLGSLPLVWPRHLLRRKSRPRRSCAILVGYGQIHRESTSAAVPDSPKTVLPEPGRNLADDLENKLKTIGIHGPGSARDDAKIPIPADRDRTVLDRSANDGREVFFVGLRD